MKGARILGLDPGFATLGIARVRLGPSGEPLEVGASAFTTEPSAKKLEVRAASDNVRRMREIYRKLDLEVAAWVPEVICCEAQSWPRNAGAATKIGMAWGVIVAVAEQYDIPIVQATPQDVKVAVAGKKTASKDDVIGAVERLCPDLRWPDRKALWEHAADAISVVLACRSSETVRAVLRACHEPTEERVVEV